jgi:hypothetical protein
MFDPDDFRGSDNVRCACGAIHPPNYSRIHCAERTCEAVGCYGCFQRCEVSNSCGRFCGEHVSEIDLGTPEHPMKVQACVRCEATELDIEDGADAVERRAA